MKYYTNNELEKLINEMSFSDFEFLVKEFNNIRDIQKEFTREKFVEIFQNKQKDISLIPNTGNIVFDLYYFFT